MSTHAVPVGSTVEAGPEFPPAPAAARSALAWALAGVCLLGAGLRFGSLGLQSYHHDEVITVMRVISGNFTEMLHAVKTSESNPPLYYVLAWGWAKLFGSAEFGLRSLSALFGAATVPVGYLIGKRLASRRAGLILAALIAVNPMLIWYSQEARSYALLVFFAALSLYFFLTALETRRGRDLGLWALSSALALCSHYFAVFPIAIEAAWLLLALRQRWRLVGPAVAAVGATGLALVPLLQAQINPTHIGWIEDSPLPARLLQTGVSFLIGETGHVIAEPPRPHFAIVPAALIAVALALLALRGSYREQRRGAVALIVGLGTIGFATAAALVGKDYVVERNLLPGLIPLLAVAAVGFGARRTGQVGSALAVLLCAYWLGFGLYVTQTPNLQRPDFRGLTEALGPALRRRAIVSWRLAAEPVRWYLADHSVRMFGGVERVGEVDIVTKPLVTARPASLPPSFHAVQQLRMNRLTLTRYRSAHPMRLWFHTLSSMPTGFGVAAVVLDGPPAMRASVGATARIRPNLSAVSR